MTQAQATAKYLRTSPMKMRRAVDLIRGQHVDEAARILRFSGLGASRDVEKLLNSAVANAEQRPGVIRENLVVRTRMGRRGPDAEAFPPAAPTGAPRGSASARHNVTLVRRDDGRRGLVGQKVHPYGYRLGVIYPWKSNWYADRDYADQLHEDVWIRTHIRSRLTRAGISSIDIERKGDQIWVFIRTAAPRHRDRPKGCRGRSSAQGRRALHEEARRREGRGHEPGLVGGPSRDRRGPARAGRRRAARRPRGVPSRRLRRAVQTAMRSGALGVRVATAGRLGGSDMGRREWYREGRVPLHTLRAKVDYGTAEAKTPQGRIGVKVWVYHGDEVPYREQELQRAKARATARARGPRPDRAERPERPERAQRAAAPAPEAAAPSAPEAAAPVPEGGES